MIEWCLLFCVCVCVFVLPCSTECDSLRDRDTDGCVTHATPINPKTHRNLAKRRAWEGWREGRGGDLSSLQTVSFDSEQEELGQMAPKPYQPPRKKKEKKKKITFFCGLEFRAFNLSVTCSTIRTVCLPSYLSHVRVSTKGVRSSDLQDEDCVILSDQLLSKPKTPLYFSQFNFYSYLTVS